jgi:hypothetical protein
VQGVNFEDKRGDSDKRHGYFVILSVIKGFGLLNGMFKLQFAT